MANNYKGLPETMTPQQIHDFVVGNPVAKDMLGRDEAQFDDAMARLHRHYGYTPEGQPLPTAQKAIKGVSEATGIPEWLTTAVAAAPIPAITTVAGAAIGAMGGGVPNPALGYVGASVGSVAGEKINADLGITEPLDITGAGIAAAAPLAPLVGRFMQPLAKGLIKKVPVGLGQITGLGRAMNEAAIDTAEEMAGRLGVSKMNVDMAYDAVRETSKQFTIATPGLAKMFGEQTELNAALESMGPAIKTKMGEKVKIMRDVFKLVKDGRPVRGDQLMTLEAMFNDLKEQYPIFKKAAGVLIDDIEANATLPTGATGAAPEAGKFATNLKRAMQLNRRFHASQDLDGYIGGAITKRSEDGMMAFNRAQFQKKLTDPDFAKAFGAADTREMIATLDNLGHIVPLPPESISGIGRAMLASAGIASAVGIPYAPMMAAGIGVSMLLSKLIQKPPARRWIADLLREQGGRITELQLQEMYGAIAGYSAGVGAVRGASAGTQRNPNPVEPFALEQ